MSRTDLLCLNRIIKPQIPLEEFLKFRADLGIKYVERVLRRLAGDDFRADVKLYSAGSHPALKCLVRFECGRDSAMRADDRAYTLSQYFERGVY
jgi:hypothetical protein